MQGKLCKWFENENENFFSCFFKKKQMPSSIYNIGDAVHRIEDREITGAIILTIIERDDDNIIEIQYDEGGTGWWPESFLRL